MPVKVQVLLSTYNGSKYLTEQVDSILNQKDIEVHLLVRDDGSRDGTVDILNRYSSEGVRVEAESNLGSTKSFLRLIEMSEDSCDYYAFADQDDFWDEDKLITAVNQLKKYTNIPAMYSSNTRLVDSNLNFLKNEKLDPITTLGSAFIKNYATGCTVVFNKCLHGYLKRYIPSDFPFHDWWVNLVCLSLGGISIYDINPHISYRQHGNNVVGAATNILGRWIQRFQKFTSSRYHRDEMAKELLNGFGDDIKEPEKSIIKIFADNNKIDLLRDPRIRTGSKLDNAMFLLCILTGRH